MCHKTFKAEKHATGGIMLGSELGERGRGSKQKQRNTYEEWVVVVYLRAYSAVCDASCLIPDFSISALIIYALDKRKLLDIYV